MKLILFRISNSVFLETAVIVVPFLHVQKSVFYFIALSPDDFQMSRLSGNNLYLLPQMSYVHRHGVFASVWSLLTDVPLYMLR